MKTLKELKSIASKYSYRVDWSEEDRVYVCSIAELPSALCHGSTHEKALNEGKAIALDILKELNETGEPIPEPISLKKFSGKFVVRTTQDLHRRLALEAQEKGVSVNKLVNEKLAST